MLKHFYALRNKEGLFYGPTYWEEDLCRARIWGSPKAPRALLSNWHRYEYDGFVKEHQPVLVELDVTGIRILDDRPRIEKAHQARLNREHQRKVAAARKAVVEAQQDLAEVEGGG